MKLLGFDFLQILLLKDDQILILLRLFDNAGNILDKFIDLLVCQRQKHGLFYFIHVVQKFIIIINIDQSDHHPLIFVLLHIHLEHGLVKDIGGNHRLVSEPLFGLALCLLIDKTVHLDPHKLDLVKAGHFLFFLPDLFFHVGDCVIHLRRKQILVQFGEHLLKLGNVLPVQNLFKCLIIPHDIPVPANQHIGQGQLFDQMVLDPALLE